MQAGLCTHIRAPPNSILPNSLFWRIKTVYLTHKSKNTTIYMKLQSPLFISSKFHLLFLQISTSCLGRGSNSNHAYCRKGNMKMITIIHNIPISHNFDDCHIYIAPGFGQVGIRKQLKGLHPRGRKFESHEGQAF